MRNVLTDLGIRKEVQDFFKDEYFTRSDGTLAFRYGHKYEYYNLKRHIVPRSDTIWIVGYQKLHFARQVLIFSSAMEAIVYISIHYEYYSSLDNIIFLSVGLCPNINHLDFIAKNFSKRKLLLVLGNDCLGRIFDLKIAECIIKKSIKITYQPGELLKVDLTNAEYTFKMDELTLSSFQKSSGVRSGIRTHKPKKHTNFLNQLLNK